MNAAHKKFMRAFNLKPMKQVAVVFNPFDPTTTYMRHFLTHLRSRPIQQQNPSCKITHELLNDKSEPHIKFFIDKTEETYTMSPRRGPMHDQWVEFMLYVNYLMTVKKVIPQYIPYSHPRKMKLAHPNDACEKDAEPEERSLYEDDGDPESTDNDGICESKTTQMFKSMTIEQIQEWSHRKMLDGTFNWGLMSVPRMPRRAMNRHPYNPGFQWHFKNTKKYPVVEYGTSEETSTTAAAAATTGAAGAKKGGGATDKKAAAPAAAKKK